MPDQRCTNPNCVCTIDHGMGRLFVMTEEEALARFMATLTWARCCDHVEPSDDPSTARRSCGASVPSQPRQTAPAGSSNPYLPNYVPGWATPLDEEEGRTGRAKAHTNVKEGGSP